MKHAVLLFGKKDCSLCEGWKRKLNHLDIKYDYYDTSTVEGMAEMAFNNVGRIPALVIGPARFEEVGPAEITSEQIQKLIDGQ
ncbi:MAG TPA: hypothetical protein PKN80_07790 [bacterium]|nr:hypothetical protein [bacterium]HNS49084.1 hypothetical protein [bacterium]